MDSSRSGSHGSIIKTTRISPERFWLVEFLLLIIFLAILFQISQLSLFHHAAFVNLAKKQHRLVVDIPALRGAILDRKGHAFATSLKTPSIYAVPRLIPEKEKDTLAGKLSDILSVSHPRVRELLGRDKSFVWIKRRVSSEEAKKIEAFKTSALGIDYEYKRFYPDGQLLANVLGFTNVDTQGIEGIERTLNEELAGKPGKRYTRRDALGREIKAFEERMIPALDGHRVVLTVDRYLQYITERALERSYRQYHAKGAAAILMNPRTGEILAMASRPTFDPNSPGDYPFENYRNRTITDMFEPGSVFKIVTATGLLSERKVTMTEKMFCENGEWQYGRKALHDVHPYGLLSFPEVIIKSSNIGTAKLASRLGNEGLYRYVKLFGFGERAGIDLEGEAPGFIRKPGEWSKTSPVAIPIGQEVMVTALQLVRAISFIANGGTLVKPHVIERVEDVHGVTLRKQTPEQEYVGLEPPIVEVLKETLWRATEQGTGKSARVKGVPVAGKTGTAQKVLPSGKGYSHSSFMGSFIGFAPADHPLLAMVVVLDDPRGAYYGGTVAAPVFAEVMEPALIHVGYSPN